MTDNFQKYRKLIELTGGLPNNNNKGNLDKYYVIELIRRGKDNPDMPAANYHLKNYYVYSWKDLDKYEWEIKNICNLMNLRAYASVNYKLMSQVALDTMAESARRIAAHDYKKFYSIFESCSGKFTDRGNNLWVVDIDDIGDSCVEYAESLLTEYINGIESKYDKNVIYSLPTRSGFHLICRPFNLQKFEDGFWENITIMTNIEKVDVKKNHLTLLYEDL